MGIRLSVAVNFNFYAGLSQFFFCLKKIISRKFRRRKISMKNLLRYLANLSTGRLILWCYFLWYLVVLVRYFDSTPRIWLTSFGLSFVVGIALYLSSTTSGNKLQRWQTIRLFMMPFCVSSFSSLVKGKNFVLIFSPDPKEIFLALLLCAIFCTVVAVLKKGKKV